MQKAKKFLLISLIVIGSLLLLATVAALIIGPRIKDITVREINKQLIVPVKVEDISFSFIRKFPYASIELKGVSSDGIKTNYSNTPLIEANSIFFQFNFWEVLGNDLKLKIISVHDAKINLRTTANGVNNYDIFKKSKNSSPDKDSLNLAIESFEFQNVDFTYINAKIKHDYAITFLDTKFSGAFTTDLYDLKADGDLYVMKLKMNEVN